MVLTLISATVLPTSTSTSPTAANPFAHYTTTTYFFWYIFYALLFLLFYIFSSPFHANRELRRHWNGYVYLSTTLYVWLFLALVFHLPVPALRHAHTAESVQSAAAVECGDAAGV